MTEELKLCAHCGSKKIRESVDGTLDFNNCLWYCEDCGADGPNNNSIDESLNAWNRRASPWVRVEDELPPRGKDFFAIMDDGCDIYAAVCLLKIDSIFPARDEHYITHWMPIPEIEG